MSQPPTEPTVHNRLIDQKTSVIVDILANRRLTKEEMEVQAARALQKLTSEQWPKPGEVLSVVIADEGEEVLAEYESRWLK
jgi:hypothetical protein